MEQLQKELHERFWYNKETGNLHYRHTYAAMVKDSIAGTVLNGHRIIRYDGQQRPASVWVWAYHHGTVVPVGARYIQYVDGDSGNTRIENLRYITSRMPIKPVPPPHIKSGVAPHNGRWRALIYVNRKTIHLGVFSTKEEAHAQRIIAEKIKNTVEEAHMVQQQPSKQCVVPHIEPVIEPQNKVTFTMDEIREFANKQKLINNKGK